MTDCALAAPVPATVPAVTARLRGRRTRPAGVPRWAWLLGVTVVPLARDDQDAPREWVLSAGAGTAHVAALIHDHADDTDRDSARGSAS